MKLFAGLVASAAAGSSVTCNNVSTGAVEMKMMVDVADVQNPAGPGADWQNNAGKWEKTFTPTNADTTEVTGNLQVTKVVDSNGCTKTTVDGVDVCVSTGHQLTFTCNYPLVDQTISTDSDFTVSGSDTTDSAVQYGSLNYALTVDADATFAIGNTVTATITPVSSGLVTATILSCQVTNTDLQIDNVVSIIDAGLTPICDLGAAITTGQGDANLGFTWSSFKWSTTKIGTSDVLENQQLTCSISLAKEPAAVNPQTCGSSGEPARGAGVFEELNEVACQGTPPSLVQGMDECKAQCEQDVGCAAYLMTDSWCGHYPVCDGIMPYTPGSKLYRRRQSSGEPARGAGSFIELNEMGCNVAPPPLPTELSLDECKAQCEQDSECAAYLMSDTWCSHYTECDERMPWPIPGSKLYLWRQ